LLIIDAAAFGAYALLWFITFVYMAAEWGDVSSAEKDLINDSEGGDTDTIQAAIAFSFFAILIWVSWVLSHFILCGSLSKFALKMANRPPIILTVTIVNGR